MTLLIVLVLFALQCLIEAKLESIMIKLKVQAGSVSDYDALNAAEHKWSAIFSGGFVLLIASVVAFHWPGTVLQYVTFILCFPFLRRIFFDYGLKIFRKRPLKAIEGDQKTDTAIRKVLGANGGILELAIDLALLAGLIFLTI